MPCSKKLIVFMSLCIALMMVVLFSDFLVPYDPYGQNLQNMLKPPSSLHFFGTDNLGRDVFSRVLSGGRLTIFSALFVIVSSSVFGTAVGLVSGYIGGVVDTIAMRFCDMLLAFPGIVLALAVAAVIGGGLSGAVFALGMISWPKFARLARAQTLRIKVMPFIDIARLSGVGRVKIMMVHILPGIYKAVLTTAVVDIGAVIMELAGLSFIGLGVVPPQAEWGAMLNGSISYLTSAPWIIIAPATAIFITVFLFNMLAEAIKETYHTYS